MNATAAVLLVIGAIAGAAALLAAAVLLARRRRRRHGLIAQAQARQPEVFGVREQHVGAQRRRTAWSNAWRTRPLMTGPGRLLARWIRCITPGSACRSGESTPQPRSSCSSPSVARRISARMQRTSHIWPKAPPSDAAPARAGAETEANDGNAPAVAQPLVLPLSSWQLVDYSLYSGAL